MVMNMNKLIAVVMCLVMALSFAACSADTETETQPTSETVASTENATEKVSTSPAPEDFVPFTCSEDDVFSFFSEIGDVSFKIDYDSNSLIRSVNDTEETVMTFDMDIKSCISVGNALYLTGDDALYRLPVDENGNCDTDSFSVVLSGMAGMPAYCFDNRMAVRVYGQQDDSYVIVDTQTGEYAPSYEINEYLSDEDIPDGLISPDSAADAALEKIKSSQFEGYFLRENYSSASGISLVHYPDFYYGISGTVWEYGNHCEYCYVVEIVADGADLTPKFTVYVNAANSDIEFISFRKS